MGEISKKIEELLKKRKLTKIVPTKELIEKELNASQYDLESAQTSLSRGDYKWAIIQGYYSMFHSARALLFSKGYREEPQSIGRRTRRIICKEKYSRTRYIKDI